MRLVSHQLRGIDCDNFAVADCLVTAHRRLVTVSALIASGQAAQITYHLNKAMDNGLTREQAGEIVTHLAFYAGWPNAFSALPVVNDVL